MIKSCRLDLHCGAACILCCRFANLSDGCCRDIAGDAADTYQAVIVKICRDLADNCQTVLVEMRQRFGRDVAYYFRP